MPHMDTIPLVDDLNGISRVDINSQTDILHFRWDFDIGLTSEMGMPA